MNVGAFLTKSARSFPEKTAIVHGKRVWTYAGFLSRANRLANALRRLGVRQGENVAILQSNCPQVLESIFACFKAGCGVVPINHRLHPKECCFIIDHSEARVVILSPEFNSSVREVRSGMPGVRHLVTLANAGEDMRDYEELLSGETDRWEDAEVRPDDLAWLFYTSGTTGRPKGAILTHRNLVAMAMNFYADMCPLGPDDAILHAAPLSHGSGVYAIPNVAKASTNVIAESKSFDPAEILKTIQDQRITNMFAAPTMFKRLVESGDVGRYDLRSLKALIYGGGPMYVEDLKAMMTALGPCLVQLYGQAESPMTITGLAHRDHVPDGTPDQMRRLASAGTARTDVEVRIFDDEDRELPPDAIGEIVTRSDLVMKGYWRDPAATAETLRNGWLHTGDVGFMDDKGYVFILDRSKDMIVSGGENIYPREIEDALLRHPSVREVAVIGVPDPEWGESVKAIVVPASGTVVTEQELIAFCKDHLASYKKPRSVEFADVLPKNSYGKVLKRGLKERYWAGRERRV